MSAVLPTDTPPEDHHAVAERPPSAEVHPIGLAIAVGVGVAVWLVPTPEGLQSNAWHLLAIFLATIVGIIIKAAPMGALSVVAIALCAGTQVLAPGEPGESMSLALSGFSNSTIWLIVSAFFVSRAVITSGLGTRMALCFVRLFGKSTLGLAYGLGLTDLALSPFIPSNTARAGGIVYPITKSICLSSGSDPNDPSTFRRIGSYLALTGYNMNLAVSVVFFTGAAPNAMAAKFAANDNVSITWGGWFLAAAVPAMVGVLLVPLVVYAMNKPELTKTPEAPAAAARDLAALGPMRRSEWVTLGVFLLMIVLWIFGGRLVSATAVAFLGLGILLLTSALTWKDMKSEKAAWDTLVWFSALVMMGTQLNELGFVGWFGDNVGSWVEGLNMGTLGTFALLTILYALAHYMFASGTAHTAAMFTVFFSVGLALGLPGVPLAVFLGAIPTIFGCLTHYGNGPAPIYYGSGYVDLGLWWKVGGVLGALYVLIWLCIGIPWWMLLGLW